jgi:RNA recognition motif-containing protein
MSDAQAPQQASDGVSVSHEKLEEVGFKVFAGNLAYSTTDEGLKAFFAPVASDILSVQIIMRGPRSAGYGFVSLANADAAEKSVESLDKQELDGRTVIVEIAKPSDQKDREKKERKSRRPGRRGAKAIPGEVTEAEANGEPSKPDGAAVPESSEAAKPKRKKKKSGRKPKKSTPLAEDYVMGEAPAEVEKVPAAEGAPAKKGRTKKPRVPRVPRPAGEVPDGEPSKTVLFVANLGFNIDDDALRNLFIEAGINVVSARVVCWRWGRPRKSKGYGFVDVGSEEEQNKGIAALQGKEVDSRPIVVKVAVNASQVDEAKATGDGDGAAESTI